jgi:AcrR family transcriptional regulator
MAVTSKLSSEERRAAIIKAVRRVFAEKGFDGTTTRELADAAGVSEALLFKHFPNKEALFSAMQLACCNEEDIGRYELLASLEPSASTLILLVHFLVSRIVGVTHHEDGQAIHNRLMIRSLAEDGEFARLFIARLATGWVPKVAECIRSAVASGEAVSEPSLPELGGWFTYHLAATILLHLLPETPVVDYGVPREQLVEQAVRFALRGVGLKEETIQRLYNPRALALYGD